jgi:hypothetical protein
VHSVAAAVTLARSQLTLTFPARFILETAVDSQRRRQVRDQSGFSTAAHFTQWVTNATAANTCG